MKGKANSKLKMLCKNQKGISLLILLCLSICAGLLSSNLWRAEAFQSPTKLVLTASPSKILTGGAYSWLTVQLQDSNGNPALASSTITVTLSSSDSSILSLTATTFTIGAGSNYARTVWYSYYKRPNTGSPAVQSTFTPGTATITATAANLTSSSVQITTSGAGGSPSKIVIQSQPSMIFADKSAIAWLIVQLQDSGGNPSVAPSAVTVSLSNSNSSIVSLSVASVTIGAGANYVSGGYDAWYPRNDGPYCTSTYAAGSATITGNSSGLQSSTVAVKTNGKTPAKLAITASLTNLITGGSISWLTVQLLDAYGNPATAASAITISLSNSNLSIVSLSVASVTIGAGANYVSGYYDAWSPGNMGPYCTSTYTPGSAIITANSTGLTSGTVTITTRGAGGTPAKLAITASLTNLITGGSISWLTVQLLDAYGNPATAASAITISLSNSNLSIVSLSVASVTIGAGANYVSGYYDAWSPGNMGPYCTSTYTPGSAIITANSTGLTSGTVTITTRGAGGTPAMIAITAQPATILANKAAYSWLTVQLKDVNGNPALAPSAITITVSSSNSSILSLTATTFTIPAGSNYARSIWFISHPNSGSPFVQSTLIPGTATITANSTGLTTGSTKITTLGSGGVPAKLVLTAQPILIPANGKTYSWLTVQLQDSNGKPSVAYSTITISLQSSNPAAMTLTATTFTIGAGSNYARSIWFISHPNSGSPFVQSTLIPGTATITATSTGLASGSVTVSSSELISLSVSIFNGSDKKQSVFNATDTTRIGATVSGVQISYVTASINDSANNVIVNNVSMTKVSGNTLYNYYYNYVHVEATPGKYSYSVTAKDAAGHVATKTGNFYIMRVVTSSDGPWSVARGGYYNASFTISVQGTTAKKLTLDVDLPYWHAVAFSELNGTAYDFSATTSPYAQYKRFSLTFLNVPSGQTLQIKLTIITANNATTGSRTIYYHSEWTTTEDYPYSDTTQTKTVNVS